ncbi:MAG: transcriptional regulator [Candidatus Eremiobacteraeota bacterium]|nr:transcriptional regulator [Candidatus Eremiobacteraeota bacterium]
MSAPLLFMDSERFQRFFDRRAFDFAHALGGHPLFEASRLLALAQRLARDPRDVYYDAGRAEVGQRWDDLPICEVPIDELLRRIETADAWIVLRKAEKDPAYAAILDTCIDEIIALAGRSLRRRMKLTNAIIFINSPHRVSTYHIDRECNFLLQIRGTKTVSVFDRYDREVLPEEEIERFWTVDNNAAVYKPQYQDRAAVHELLPGRGVHMPINAPHWVQNGPEVSVSLSINFHEHDRELADIYRVNHWLRRSGLRPTPPRQSRFIDGIKRGVYGSTRSVRRVTRHLWAHP